MIFLFGLLASLAVIQAAPHIGHYSYPAATTLVRVPSHDSALVHSTRFGSNFAYSIAQLPAFRVSNPFYSYDPILQILHREPSVFSFTYPGVEQYYTNVEVQPTKNPDAESVVIDNADLDAPREDTPPETADEFNDKDNADDSVSVEAYPLGGDNNN